MSYLDFKDWPFSGLWLGIIYLLYIEIYYIAHFRQIEVPKGIQLFVSIMPNCNAFSKMLYRFK